LTELEEFSAKKIENIVQSRCASILETNPERLTAVIAAKGILTCIDTTKCNTTKCGISQGV
jgi:hypothetical protein